MLIAPVAGLAVVMVKVCEVTEAGTPDWVPYRLRGPAGDNETVAGGTRVMVAVSVLVPSGSTAVAVTVTVHAVTWLAKAAVVGAVYKPLTLIVPISAAGQVPAVTANVGLTPAAFTMVAVNGCELAGAAASG
jgi:hypothetical protein